MIDERASSPAPEHKISGNENKELYGSRLLQHICASIKDEKLSKLVIPVVVMSFPKHEEKSQKLNMKKALHNMEADLFIPAKGKRATMKLSTEQQLSVPYIDIGAVDVLGNPIQEGSIPPLTVHIYRIYKEWIQGRQDKVQATRQRKRSWVGLGDSKPYAYLREAMVSGLMDGICSLSSETFAAVPVHLEVSEPRQLAITEALANWSFSAHDFCEDELLWGAATMLEHALAMPDLEPWRIPTSESAASFPCCVCGIERKANWLPLVLSARSRFWIEITRMNLALDGTNETNRIPAQFPRCLPLSIQLLRSLPQLQACNRRPPSSLLLPRQTRHPPTISPKPTLSNHSTSGSPPNPITTRSLRCFNLADHGNWSRRRPPRRKQRLSRHPQRSLSTTLQ